MFACVLNRDGDILLHRNMKADNAHLDRLVKCFPGDLVIAVECIFTWYWIADFCDERDIPFVLGHALYMKAIPDAWASNERSE
jgi:hypothetical protein